MTTKRTLAIATLAAALLATTAAACGGSSKTATQTTTSSVAGTQQTKVGSISGAGSTLVWPLLSNWASDYQKQNGVTVTYGPVGSGGGIQAISNRTVDFGASDAPLTPDQMKSCGACVEIPWALSATTVSYDVPGIGNHLHLDGPTIAGIFLGQIANWNDPKIAKLNPGMKLPSLKITPAYRSEGSGDTYAFTDYLSHVSPAWKAKVGTSTSVSFPAGVGAKGNSGVAGVIAQTKGAVGYVSVAYAQQNHLNVAAIENRAGNFVAPNLAGISAAAAAMGTIGPDNTVSLANPPASAPQAYPIATFTYAIVPKSSPKAQALKQMLTYAIGPGQKDAARFVFAKLPPKVVAIDKRAIASIGS